MLTQLKVFVPGIGCAAGRTPIVRRTNALKVIMPPERRFKSNAVFGPGNQLKQDHKNQAKTGKLQEYFNHFTLPN